MTEADTKATDSAGRALSVVVRTPHQTALEEVALSLRLPAESGHVGLRLGAEPTILAVEAGIALVRTVKGTRYLGTPGGLLRFQGRRAVLLTPFCVSGESPAEVASRLEEAMAEPSAEMDARKTLEKIEERIIRDLRPAGGDREAGPRRSREI